MRKIIWEKWKDPLWPNLKKQRQLDQDEDDSILSSLEEFDEDEEDPGYANRRRIGPCMVSPLGIIPLTEANIPSRLYDLWMGHTNFGITEQIQEAIALVPGVEVLATYTPYRFRVGFGKAFNGTEVRKAIEELVKEPEPAVSREGIVVPHAMLRRSLSKKFKFWSILELGDPGAETIEVAGGDTQAEVMTKTAKLGQADANIVICSWETK